jgi:hypothetical protein
MLRWSFFEFHFKDFLVNQSKPKSNVIFKKNMFHYIACIYHKYIHYSLNLIF